MTYITIRDMHFMKNGSEKTRIVIPANIEVTAVIVETLKDPEEKASCLRIEAKHKRRFRSQRLAFFRYEGVIRTGVIGKDLVAAVRRGAVRRVRT